MPVHLVDRSPVVDPETAVAALVPPPRFAAARFASFVPDPTEPSQEAALAVVRDFAATLSPAPGWRRRRPATVLPGVYLDGGFGVGKTHLITSLWHAAPAPRAYCTFVELTHLVGALGFNSAVDALAGHRLLAIDEFELDDPGDTVLVSTLLGRLVAAGVRVAATSNTLPDALGEGRFAASDFLREIQGLAAHFLPVRIEGPDYRHRGLPAAPRPLSDAELRATAQSPRSSHDRFDDVLTHLARLHPSRYGPLLDGLDLVCLEQVRTVEDQAAALRLVVLVDRLYDRDIAVAMSGIGLAELFPLNSSPAGIGRSI